MCVQFETTWCPFFSVFSIIRHLKHSKRVHKLHMGLFPTDWHSHASWDLSFLYDGGTPPKNLEALDFKGVWGRLKSLPCLNITKAHRPWLVCTWKPFINSAFTLCAQHRRSVQGPLLLCDYRRLYLGLRSGMHAVFTHEHTFPDRLRPRIFPNSNAA